MSRAVYAVMGAVLFVALVITTAAFASLLLDQDVIDERDAGPLLGPAMVAVAALAVLLALFRAAALSDAAERGAPRLQGTFPAQPAVDDDGITADGVGRDEPAGAQEARGARGTAPSLLVPAVTTAAVVYVAMLLVGSVWYGLQRHEAVAVLLFAAHYAVSVFVIGAAVWAGLVVAGVLALGRVAPGPPRVHPG
ncbi:DUF6121 family protein [Frigoribacterium sp. 2-23]|uniref:DUF6121 family protein n=1 Tax=Frigoribacterium sp. 2-23 TaxID=3415006 RepID=UPI003C700DCF